MNRTWRGEEWAVWLSVHHAPSVWQAVQPLRYPLVQAGAVVSLVLTVSCLSSPGPYCSIWVCVAFPPPEQCPSLLVCFIPIPPILPSCLYNESGCISFKNFIKKTLQPNLPPPNKCGFGFWLSFLRCLNSCRKASASLLVCADLSWTQLIYEIYPKQSWLTSKVWWLGCFFFFFPLHGNLITGG